MSDTDLIKDKIDIVDFIGEYIQLRPAGSRHKACCPFHQEKSPSFMVSRERQSWHCFGCGKGGDVFSFLQEMEGMDFVEALKYLAGRAGVELTTKVDNVRTDQKAKLKSINIEAARFFHKFLVQMDAAKGARAYLTERGVSDETIQEWQIGFIPDQWDLLTQYLLKKGHSIDDLVLAGLTIKRDGADRNTGRGFYDRFRGRIMFPICDIHGSVAGFTGRVLVETEHSGGKYVNTPETPLFDKSRLMFGLHKAKQPIKQEQIIVMVEGQMDVIACHQAGMKYVVATSGTALTEHHVQLLKRYAPDLYLAFDSDSAGERAAKRGIELALEAGMHVKIIQIPEGAGKDPDECVKKNPQVWFETVRNAKDVIAWYLERSLKDKNLSDPRQKQQVASEVLPQVARIPFAIERDHWLQELARRIGVDVSLLREELVASRPKTTASHTQPQAQPKGIPKDRYTQLLEQFLMVVLKFPQVFTSAHADLSLPAVDKNPYFSLYAALKKQYTTNNGLLDVTAFRHAVTYDEQHLIDVLLLQADEEFSHTDSESRPQEPQVQCEHLFAILTHEWKKREGARIQMELQEAEAQGDAERIAALLEQVRGLL